MNKLLAQAIRLLLRCYRETGDDHLLVAIEKLTLVTTEEQRKEDAPQLRFVGSDGKTTAVGNVLLTFPENCDFTSLIRQGSEGRSQFNMGFIMDEEENKDDNGEEEPKS